MTQFIYSAIGSAIACSISVFITAKAFYKLGKEHGRDEREREIHMSLVSLTADMDRLREQEKELTNDKA